MYFSEGLSAVVVLLCLKCFTAASAEMAEDNNINKTGHSTSSLIPEEDISSEKLLVRYLLNKYDRLGKESRPVKNTSHPVVVEFGLGLIQMELQEKENVLSMSAWSRFRWRDEYLTWDPDQYDGVSQVKIDYMRIWVPDIMLYNTASTDDAERKVRAVVHSDGTVLWFPHRVFQSSCAIDVRNFPFDNQTCHLWFGSWTHSVNEIDLQLAFPGGLDLSTFQSVYKEASEWEIANSTAERMIQPPEGSPQYAIVSLTLHLKRKMMFSTYILTMPAIFLSFLTLLVFWLPPEHADKSALGLTIFGSLLLLLLILVEAAPPTASAVPLLGLYYCFTTVIVILSIFLSSLVVKLGSTGSPSSPRTPVPRWAKMAILHGLARLLCIRGSRGSWCCLASHRSSHRYSGTADLSSKPRLDTHDGVIMRDFLEDVCCNGTSHVPNVGGGGGGGGSGSGSTAVISALERQLKALHGLLSGIIQRQEERESNNRCQLHIEAEWRELALVLDRLFFIVYLVVIVASLLFLFPRSPIN